MILSFLVGALLKVYDDFVDDEPYITNEHIVKILQYVQICLVTLLLSNDFWLTLVFGAFNLVCAFSSFQEYTGPHVVAYSALVPILLISSWKSRLPFGTSMDIAMVVVLLGLALFEPKVFPEETSFLKGLSRFNTAITSITVGLLLPLSPSMVSVFFLQAGYCTASSMAQMLKLTCLPTCPT